MPVRVRLGRIPERVLVGEAVRIPVEALNRSDRRVWLDVRLSCAGPCRPVGPERWTPAIEPGGRADAAFRVATTGPGVCEITVLAYQILPGGPREVGVRGAEFEAVREAAPRSSPLQWPHRGVGMACSSAAGHDEAAVAAGPAGCLTLVGGAVSPHPISHPLGAFFIVDGEGTRSSALVVDLLLDGLSRPASAGPTTAGEELSTLLERVHSSLRSTLSGKTASVAAAVVDWRRRVVWASGVGSVGLFLIDPGGTAINLFERPPLSYGRNLRLGLPGLTRPPHDVSAVTAGSWIVACTDGLLGAVSEGEIRDSVLGSRGSAEAAQSLVSMASARTSEEATALVVGPF